MNAKEFFERARTAEREIHRLECLRDHYVSVGASITAKWGGVNGGSNNNSSKVEAAALGKFEAEIVGSEEVRKYRKIVAEAEQVVSQIPQERFRQILTFYYLSGKSMSEISDILRYDDRNSVYRARRFALNEAQKILDKME